MSVLSSAPGVVVANWAAQAPGDHSGGHAPNPILPEFPEIVLGTIAFLLLLFVLSKYVFPVFERLHRERVDAIEGGMQRAEAAQREAEQLRSDYQQSLQQARSEAARIRTEAQAERAAIIEQARLEAREAAEQEASRARQRLQADIASARQALVAEVGTLAVDLANRVVGENLSESEVTSRTVDRFMDGLEEQLRDQAGQPLAASGGQHR